MNGPTPDQLRRIDNLVKLFDKDWYADTQTKEIRRKPQTDWQRVVDVFWKRKHTVFAMYWWIKQNWANEKLIIHEYPIRGDNMPIKGFPVKCELQGGWTIPRHDNKYLTHGPLASEGLQEILVPESRGLSFLIEVFKQFGPIATSISMVVGIVSNWPKLVTAFQTVKNAF